MRGLFLGLAIVISYFSHTPYLEKNIYGLSKINSIPKVIHQIWVGGGKIPEEYKKYMRTWKDKHPGWEYKLWTDDDIEGFEWINRKHFDNAANPGMKSDIWRYEIVYRYGGVYIDCDMECIRPLDPLHERLEFYTGFNGHKKTLGNHIFGAKKESLLMFRTINLLSRSLGLWDLKKVSSDEIQKLTGPFFFTYSIRERVLGLPNEREVILPKEYFQPVSYARKKKRPTKKEREEEEMNVLERCFGVHHNGLSWEKQPVLK